jgi:hypothetical protein
MLFANVRDSIFFVPYIADALIIGNQNVVIQKIWCFGFILGHALKDHRANRFKIFDGGFGNDHNRSVSELIDQKNGKKHPFFGLFFSIKTQSPSIFNVSRF